MTQKKLDRQLAWNVMLRRAVFNAEDFQLLGGPGSGTYLEHLIKAGYVASIAPGYPHIYKLQTPTGFLAPDFRQGKLNDPNLADGVADIAQRTWQVLRMSKQVSLHDLQTVTQISSRSKISEYCAKLLDAQLLALREPPVFSHAASYHYQLPVDLGPIAPIPTAEGVWDCNANPEVLYEYQP
jgi:hypothetical protein